MSCVKHLLLFNKSFLVCVINFNDNAFHFLFLRRLCFHLCQFVCLLGCLFFSEIKKNVFGLSIYPSRCEHDISRTPWWYFFKFGSNAQLDSRINWLEFWWSKVKGSDLNFSTSESEHHLFLCKRVFSRIHIFIKGIIHWSWWKKIQFIYGTDIWVCEIWCKCQGTVAILVFMALFFRFKQRFLFLSPPFSSHLHLIFIERL